TRRNRTARVKPKPRLKRKKDDEGKREGNTESSKGQEKDREEGVQAGASESTPRRSSVKAGKKGDLVKEKKRSESVAPSKVEDDRSESEGRRRRRGDEDEAEADSEQWCSNRDLRSCKSMKAGIACRPCQKGHKKACTIGKIQRKRKTKGGPPGEKGAEAKEKQNEGRIVTGSEALAIGDAKAGKKSAGTGVKGDGNGTKNNSIVAKKDADTRGGQDAESSKSLQKADHSKSDPRKESAVTEKSASQDRSVMLVAKEVKEKNGPKMNQEPCKPSVGRDANPEVDLSDAEDRDNVKGDVRRVTPADPSDSTSVTLRREVATLGRRIFDAEGALVSLQAHQDVRHKWRKGAVRNGVPEGWDQMIPQAYQQPFPLEDQAFHGNFQGFDHSQDREGIGSSNGIVPPFDESQSLWNKTSSIRISDQSDASSIISSQWPTPNGGKTRHRESFYGHQNSTSYMTNSGGSRGQYVGATSPYATSGLGGGDMAGRVAAGFGGSTSAGMTLFWNPAPNLHPNQNPRDGRDDETQSSSSERGSGTAVAGPARVGHSVSNIRTAM
ncbi:hypothetical protein BKA70DRAFT_1245132, partial [Coprinopsis sp. MPI-PUGE-AT-0042]